MYILNREELCDLIRSKNCIESDIVKKDIDKGYTSKSSVQPCSVDLHVGEMYIPEKKDTSIGGKTNPNTDEVILKPGGSLLVRIEEEISLPNNVGGVCFAPARLSLNGLLIVNIGHIDPGFVGKLHFTVINLGKEESVLRKNDVICTLLLFKLSNDTVPFGPETTVDIKGKSVPKIVNDSLPRLANTFMNFEKKAYSITRSEVSKANLRLPLIIAVITIGIPIAFSIFSNTLSMESKYEKRISELEKQIQQMKEQDKINERLINIENIIRTNDLDKKK